jgi:hypothetical protein
MHHISKRKIQKLKDILSLSKKNHKLEILKQRTIKDAHIYCKINKLSGQVYGPLLESYIIKKEGMLKNSPSICAGDASLGNINVEIKISLGGERTHRNFNYVQIRPHHTIDYYLLTAYYLAESNLKNEGDLYIFLLHHSDMSKIISKHGQYAHGTNMCNGSIAGRVLRSSIHNNHNNLEYALRPKYDDTCWRELMPFRIDHTSPISKYFV